MGNLAKTRRALGRSVQGLPIKDKNRMASESILLVDDTTANMQVLRETLNGSGYKLLIVKNELSELEIVRKAHPYLS